MGIRRYMLLILIIRGVLTGQGGVRWGGDMRLLAAACHEAHDLAQPIECEQRHRVSWRRIRRRPRIVGRTHGECGVGAIGEPHDKVWISTLPDPDHGNTLAV